MESSASEQLHSAGIARKTLNWVLGKKANTDPEDKVKPNVSADKQRLR